MATKKRKRKSSSGGAVARRRSSGLSSGGTRRRTRRRKKTGLSEMFSKETAMASAKGTLAGAAGGGAAILANNMMPASWGKAGKVITALAGGFLMSSVVGSPSTGAGFTGGMIALAFQNGFLNDDANFADEDSLDEEALYLDENGKPLTLNDDGSFSRAPGQDEYTDYTEVD